MICVLEAASREPATATMLKAVWRSIGAPLTYPNTETWTAEQLRIAREQQLIVETDSGLNFNPELQKLRIFARGGVPHEESILVGALMGLTERDVDVLLDLRAA